MKAHPLWSYAPYTPPFHESGDPYICRVAPEKNGFSFDWLFYGKRDGENGASAAANTVNFTVYGRERGENAFTVLGETTKRTFYAVDLKENTDYEFYVAAGENGELGKSRVRLVRTGESVGTTVNYLHPDDNAYSFSGRYLCSPSLVRLKSGTLLASMDVYGKAYPQNLTLIFASNDDGKTWHYRSELFPCYWGTLFEHRGELYMLSVSTEYGDLLIGKSFDEGKTFSAPTVLLRGSNGKNGETGVHKYPHPLLEFDGRLYCPLEWGSWGRGYHAAMVMSAPSDADLTDPSVWTFSEPLRYNPAWDGVAKGESSGNIEGSLLEIDGKLYNLMRYDTTKTEPRYGKAISYKVNTDDPESPLVFDECFDFPGNLSKFLIRFDPRTRRYYTLASRITDPAHISARNLLSLLSSRDGKRWEVVKDVYDYRASPAEKVGFQYVNFFIEGDKLLFLCRTAQSGAHSFHDSNYITFDTLTL